MKKDETTPITAPVTFTYTPTYWQGEETVTLYVNGVGASYTLKPEEIAGNDESNLNTLVTSILPTGTISNNVSSTAVRNQLSAVLSQAEGDTKASLQETLAANLNYGAADANYALENQIAVSTSVTDEAASYFTASKVEMVGGALNMEPKSSEEESTNRTVVLQVSEPNPASKYTNHAEEFSFDLSLLVDGSPQKELNFPVKVTLPVPEGYDMGAVQLFHLHDGVTPTEVVVEKDTQNHTVTFTTTSFSTYIFAQGSAPDLPDDGSTGGSSGGTSTYPPAVTEPEGGDVSVRPANPIWGQTVTITPKPDAGQEVDSVTVTDRNGDPVAVIDNGDGTYSFTQPSGRVTIAVTFREIPEPEPEHHPFRDVPDTAWYAGAVQYVWENGLMTGTDETTFSPAAETSRGMIAAILWRLEGEPAAGESGFADVAGQMYYAEAIAWAKDNGIVNGVSDTEFQPDRAITREELAAILYRYAAYKGYDVTARADLSGYSDAGAISPYAVEAMQWANAVGIVNGTSGTTLAPQGGAIRAQAAAMLMRLGQLTAAE